MAKVIIALLVAVLYIWVIMVTMPYRREVIQNQDLTDYYANLDLEFSRAKNDYESRKANANTKVDQLLDAEERLALLHWEKREYDRAVELLDDVVNKRKPAADAPYDDRYINSLLHLAGVYRDVNNWQVAEMQYQDVYSYDKRFFEKTDPDNSKIARDLNNLGLLYYLKGTSEKDEKSRNEVLKQSSGFLNEALKKYRAKLGADSPSEAISLWNLYLAERDQGNVDLANKLKAKAESIDAKMNRPVKAP
ncbi:MAG: hypothetical protein SGJ27_03785 [Candidatus Melainabacteria bacterium]|nr:hypothetical protein [Candidatus Melainabacteria bacterium]